MPNQSRGESCRTHECCLVDANAKVCKQGTDLAEPGALLVAEELVAALLTARTPALHEQHIALRVTGILQ